MHIQGGGGPGIGSIVILSHQSLTTDFNPLYIEAGTLNAPLVDVRCSYCYHQAQSVYIAATVTGGTLRLSGLIDTPNSLGVSGVYAIDCQSAAMIIDVAGLQQLNRSTLAGAVWHVNPDNIRGVSSANLGNPVIHGAAPKAMTANSGTTYVNGARTLVIGLMVDCAPGTAADSYVTVKMGPVGSTMPIVLREIRKLPLGATTAISTYATSLAVPPYWSYRVDIVDATINALTNGYYV